MHEQAHTTSPTRTVAVLGGGAWGTTLAILAHETGSSVSLIAHREETARHLDVARAHPVSLPGITIPKEIRIGWGPDRVLEQADLVILAVPTQKLRLTLGEHRNLLASRTILSAIKGLEIGTHLRPSQVIEELIDGAKVAALSGPNLAREIADRHPATSVVAAENEDMARKIVPFLHSRRFRVYTSPDIVGVELGGALKNVIAIGAGIGDGLGAGDNAKAAFITRGIAEIARLGMACGANPLTFAGLSGIGDLIATCASPQSRNHRVGVALAGGTSLEAILAGMTEVAEGVTTTQAALELGRAMNVAMPITEQMHRILYEGVSPVDAISRLMEREPTREALT